MSAPARGRGCAEGDHEWIATVHVTGRRTYGVLTDSEGVTGVEVGYDDDEPFEDLYAVSCRRCQVEAPGGLFDAVAWELGVGA